MRGKGRKKAKWISNNIIGIITLSFEVFPTVISYLRKKEVGWVLFLLLINIPVILFIYKILAFGGAILKQYKMYKYARRKLKERAMCYCDTLKLDYSLLKEELREKFIARCLVILAKRGLSFCILIGTVAFVSICNPLNAHAYWNKLMGFTSKEDNGSVERDKDDADNESKEIEEITQQIRDAKWRFILDEPAYSFVLEAHLEKQVFFEIDKSGTEWEKYVQETVEQWKGEKEGVNYITVKDGEGNNFFTYTEMEDDFKKKVGNTSQYIYYDEWLNVAPHSFEYDDCIGGREILNKIEVDGKTGCYEICWKLANDYQYYAQEYEQQTTNAEAILYYYAKSIYYCMEALKYSISEEEYNKTYHYMVMRYHDMYRNGCIVPQKYKKEAKSIYSILVKSDVKSQLSNNMR